MANSAISRKGFYIATVQGTYTGVASASTTTPVDGPIISITPTATSSVIWCVGSIQAGVTTYSGVINLLKDGVNTFVGDTQASTERATLKASSLIHKGITFISSPATTSSTTYKCSINLSSASPADTVQFNFTNSDTDNSSTIRTACSLQLVEMR